jgi:membrane complex biogenesis BtpA family protein
MNRPNRWKIIGMLHAPPLPGSPACALAWPAIREYVLRDAEALAAGNVDAMLLENLGDAPYYPNRVPPHTAAFLAVLARDVKRAFGLPLGINVLRNDALSALAVAAAAEAEFIRVNVYTGARLTDQGIIQGEAHEALRYRKLLGAGVHLFADVAVKHSAALAARDLREDVEDAVKRGRADAVVVSGPATGRATRIADLKAAKEAAAGTPVLAGSGVTAGNIAEMLGVADGVIVGTALQQGGRTGAPVDKGRVRALVAAARGRA